MASPFGSSLDRKFIESSTTCSSVSLSLTWQVSSSVFNDAAVVVVAVAVVVTVIAVAVVVVCQPSYYLLLG